LYFTPFIIRSCFCFLYIYARGKICHPSIHRALIHSGRLNQPSFIVFLRIVYTVFWNLSFRHFSPRVNAKCSQRFSVFPFRWPFKLCCGQFLVLLVESASLGKQTGFPSTCWPIRIVARSTTYANIVTRRCSFALKLFLAFCNKLLIQTTPKISALWVHRYTKELNHFDEILWHSYWWLHANDFVRNPFEIYGMKANNKDTTEVLQPKRQACRKQYEN